MGAKEITYHAFDGDGNKLTDPLRRPLLLTILGPTDTPRLFRCRDTLNNRELRFFQSSLRQTNQNPRPK